MHVILTGATGLVGASVLHYILSLPPTSAAAQKIARLSIISRREEIPLLQHPECPKTNTRTKVEVLKHTDFGSYDKDILSKLKAAASSGSGDADGDGEIGVIWALGISQREVKNTEELDLITRRFPLEAAKAFSTSLDAKQVNFVYVSGEGANWTPGIFTPQFGRIKGQTERELLELMRTEPYSKTLKAFAARPGGVDAGASVGGQKEVWEAAQRRGFRKNWSFRAMESTLLPVLRSGVWMGMHSPTEEMAKVLTELAIGDGEAVKNVKGVEAEGRVVPNVAMRRIGGSMQ